MPSLRHNAEVGPGEPSDAVLTSVLDAARESILAVGWRRSTLTDVARRAGVSRMTIYRRWPDMGALVREVMTREWTSAPGIGVEPTGTPLRQVVGAVTSTARALRGNELFTKILEVDPELLLPYLLDRRGRTQDALLAGLEAGIAEGQRDGSVRAGDPALLARSVLLTAQGFLFSARTMTGPSSGSGSGGPVVDDFDAELGSMVERYLAP